MTILHSFGICVAYLLVSQGFVHATIEIIDSFGRKVEDFPNRYATVIEATMEGYIESANPSDACTEIDPPTFATNFTMKKMVLINGTTTCDFLTKVQNAKAVGYSIAVLFDPTPEPFNYMNMTFPLLDANLSVVLLLYEDAIVIRNNFLYHNNISEKENFIISISSNAQNSLNWGQIIFGGLLMAGILTFCCLIVMCIKDTCCWIFRKCRNLDEEDDDDDDDDPETQRIRSAFQDVMDRILEEYAFLRQGTEEQRRNALRNLKKRHPSKEYSEDHQFDIVICAICKEDFKAGDKIRVLNCSHEYHVDCIDDCLVRKSRRDTCPLCQSEVNMANSPCNSTESTRLLTSRYGLYSSSRSDNSYGPTDAAYGDAAYGDAAYGDAAYGDAAYGDAAYGDALRSTDESSEPLAGAEGSVNYVQNELDDDDQQGLLV